MGFFIILIIGLIASPILSAMVATRIGINAGKAAQKNLSLSEGDLICGCGHHKSYHKDWKMQKYSNNAGWNWHYGACTWDFDYGKQNPGCSCQKFEPKRVDRLAELEALINPMPDLEAIEQKPVPIKKRKA